MSDLADLRLADSVLADLAGSETGSDAVRAAALTRLADYDCWAARDRLMQVIAEGGDAKILAINLLGIQAARGADLGEPTSLDGHERARLRDHRLGRPRLMRLTSQFFLGDWGGGSDRSSRCVCR